MAILANLSGMFSPMLSSDDPYFYAMIAKNMLINNDWINLSYAGQGWLDKPHLPFWLTALSFKLFGINAVAYALPGFIFHLIGAFYTYQLAKYLYDRKTALIALVIYLTTLHLMLSAIDVRAEAYLLGTIIPAVYYWLKYDNSETLKLRYLLLGSLFTALAMMTKGPFVVITIFSA